MPSVRNYNQTAPFWDFIADLENQGSSHPFFGGNRNTEEDNTPNMFNSWAAGPGGWPFGPMPHRGRRGGPHGPYHHHGPPPPPPPEQGHPPPPPQPASPTAEPEQPEAGPSEPRGPPPPFTEEPQQGWGQHRRPGRCGGRGGWGGRGRGGPRGFPMGGPPFLNNLAEMFQSQLFGDEENSDSNNKAAAEDFKPEVDIFDTADSFVVHVSLPGAKKEDVGVNWDAEKSELSIAGVTYRPGDEELLKTLVLDERRVGAFERKVRLGSRANPAQVDIDGITAKMEDGVLRVDVPKLDSGYVEIKKVDIE